MDTIKNKTDRTYFTELSGVSIDKFRARVDAQMAEENIQEFLQKVTRQTVEGRGSFDYVYQDKVNGDILVGIGAQRFKLTEISVYARWNDEIAGVCILPLIKQWEEPWTDDSSH